jgi:hypothetical protein
MIASIYYSDGPHTGSGAAHWGVVVLVLNFVIVLGR